MHPIILQFQEILQGSYPDWVWKHRPSDRLNHVPVFTFHTVQPEAFEMQLRFLKENGYHTITADMLYAFINEGKKTWEKAVMLTFDDGRKSVWCTVYPLLKKYKMCATVFLSPVIIDESNDIFSNLEDVWQNKTDFTDITQCDQSTSPVLTWKEVQLMHQSGIIDFQCHSFSHQKIPVAPRIIGFVAPETIDTYYFKFGVPYYAGVLPGKSDPSEYLGAPIYQSAPALSDRPMFKEDRELREKCIETVKTNGNRAFFNHRQWENKLWNVVDKNRHRISNPKFESQSEQTERLLFELIEAKKNIESHLTGHVVQHLAYPWGTGSDIAIHCSRQVGYQTNFWSTLPHRSQNLFGSDLFHLVRLKHDYIRRLPGKERLSLADVFFYKLKRRAGGNIDY